MGPLVFITILQTGVIIKVFKDIQRYFAQVLKIQGHMKIKRILTPSASG